MLPPPSIAYQPALMPRMSVVFADVMGSDHCQVLLCVTGRRPSRSDGGRIHARTRLPRPKSLLQVLCLPTAPVLPIVRNGDFDGSRFYGQLFTQELLALYTIWLCEF